MDETEVPPREPGRSPGLQGQLLRPRALAAELFRPSRVNSQRLPRGFHSGGSTPGEDIGSERRTRRKPQEWCFNVILTTTKMGKKEVLSLKYGVFRYFNEEVFLLIYCPEQPIRIEPNSFP